MVRRIRIFPLVVLLVVVSHLLAVKSYVPQLVRMIQRLCVYITKHQATMNPYLSTAQQNALQAVVSACAAFYGVQIEETP